CEYLHLSQVDEIAAHAGNVDLCLGRYFFIHQNWSNANWILQLFHDLLGRGGAVAADFYSWQDGALGKKPNVIHRPGDPLDPAYPSCVFEYPRQDIHALAAECGFKVERIDPSPQHQRLFATLTKL